MNQNFPAMSSYLPSNMWLPHNVKKFAQSSTDLFSLQVGLGVKLVEMYSVSWRILECLCWLSLHSPTLISSVCKTPGNFIRLFPTCLRLAVEELYHVDLEVLKSHAERFISLFNNHYRIFFLNVRKTWEHSFASVPASVFFLSGLCTPILSWFMWYVSCLLRSISA